MAGCRSVVGRRRQTFLGRSAASPRACPIRTSRQDSLPMPYSSHISITGTTTVTRRVSRIRFDRQFVSTLATYNPPSRKRPSLAHPTPQTKPLRRQDSARKKKQIAIENSTLKGREAEHKISCIGLFPCSPIRPLAHSPFHRATLARVSVR